MSRTIRLDDDVAARLEEAARRAQKTVDEFGNEVLRENVANAPEPLRKPFHVRARNMGPFLIDVSCTGRALAMLDEMDEK